jgi:hypothetical protein
MTDSSSGLAIDYGGKPTFLPAFAHLIPGQKGLNARQPSGQALETKKR